MPSDALPDDPEMLKAMLLAERMRNERLRQITKELQRHRFGRRAETLPEDQMLLGLEDVEQTAASDEAIALLSAPRPAPAKVAKTLEMFALSFQLISRWLDESPAACRGTLEALYLVDQNFATNGPPKR